MKRVLALISICLVAAVSHGSQVGGVESVQSQCDHECASGNIIRRTNTTTTTTTTTLQIVDEYCTNQCGSENPEEIDPPTTTTITPTGPQFPTAPTLTPTPAQPTDLRAYCQRLATNRFHQHPDDTTCTRFVYCGVNFIVEGECDEGNYFQSAAQSCNPLIPYNCRA